ncbi:MAG: iron-containing alcohol dehydrogenase [Pirellulaceae bacterium]|nr:iron-containing alcohol dehydrogenase [Pirellulaceae bacterium]
MRTTWNFFSAGQLTFGAGAAAQLGPLAQRRGLRRLLVITDRNLNSAGLTEQVVAPLRTAGCALQVFDEGEAEPSLATAERAVAMAGQFQPEGIVGLGGGSNMDLAKIVATVFTHGGSPRDYFGWDQVPGPILPVLCVPTTAGTGSEVSHAAVLTDTEQQVKVSSLSNYLRPALAIVDPDLTLSCPRQVTADSGIDALTHAIEACTATDYDRLEVPAGQSTGYDGRNALGDCLADKAIELIGRYLVRAVDDGGDREAREQMALAATLAGLAFSNCGVALVHALEYPLGGALHCSHGGGNGLLLPYVMRFNLPEREAALARIARLLGEDTSGDDQRQAAERAIAAVSRLRERIGIPLRIRDLGGRREQLPEFAEKTFAIKRLLWVNPRRASQQDLLEILEAAF